MKKGNSIIGVGLILLLLVFGLVLAFDQTRVLKKLGDSWDVTYGTGVDAIHVFLKNKSDEKATVHIYQREYLKTTPGSVHEYYSDDVELTPKGEAYIRLNGHVQFSWDEGKITTTLVSGENVEVRIKY
jgi:hypothetical protein